MYAWKDFCEAKVLQVSKCNMTAICTFFLSPAPSFFSLHFLPLSTTHPIPCHPTTTEVQTASCSFEIRHISTFYREWRQKYVAVWTRLVSRVESRFRNLPETARHLGSSFSCCHREAEFNFWFKRKMATPQKPSSRARERLTPDHRCL